MNTAIVLLAALACGQTFTVVNKMPATSFVVANKCQPCTLCDACQCTSCACPELEARLAKPPPAPPKQTATRTVVSHTYSQGHTHACPNASCPFRKTYGEPYVWNHGVNASHACPYRRTEQRYVSRLPVTALVTVAAAAPVPAAVPRAAPVATFSSTSAV